MKYKSIFSIILVIALLTISIFAAGCAENGSTVDETPTATPTQAPTEQPTVEPTVEPTEEPTIAGEPEQISIRIKSYDLLGGDRQINTGDTVKFLNDETSSHLTRCVVGEDIWDKEQCLSFRKSVIHTFNDTGVYAFYIQGREELTKIQITVV